MQMNAVFHFQICKDKRIFMHHHKKYTCKYFNSSSDRLKIILKAWIKYNLLGKRVLSGNLKKEFLGNKNMIAEANKHTNICVCMGQTTKRTEMKAK